LQAIWERYRDQFPVTKNLIYLNHAAVSPLSRRCAEAMQGLAQDALDWGSFHYGDWMETYDGLRKSTAQLINAKPADIAIVKNTSEGVATIAMGMDWKPGDVMVAFVEEFPANFFPWKQLESEGVVVRWLSIYDPLERIDEAARGAKLLAISFVNYLNGYRVNLKEIGEICARHECFYFVDAIQGMGVFPIDVEDAKIDALAADAHKWMIGPEGCGVLYVRQERQKQIKPRQIGWTNFAHYNDYASRDMTLRPDAGRYESGTLNTIGCYGVRAAVDFLLEVGVENIRPAVQGLADRIYEGAQEIGFERAISRTPETGSGIVTVRRPGVDSALIARKLKDAGIVVATRQGWVRLSPHFYISPDDIERTLAELKETLKHRDQ
jgi:cysteine desulfurase/selenocysteine lyase